MPAGHDGVIVRDIRSAFRAFQRGVSVIALDPASPPQFAACAIAGADTAAVSGDLCRALLSHPLTNRGIDQFLGDVNVFRRSWPGF